MTTDDQVTWYRLRVWVDQKWKWVGDYDTREEAEVAVVTELNDTVSYRINRIRGQA